MQAEKATFLNRLSFVVMTLLVAAFCFSVASVVVAHATKGEKMAANRESALKPGSDDDDDDSSGPGQRRRRR